MWETKESEEEGTHILEKLEKNKAMGPDGVLGHILKEYKQQLSRPKPMWQNAHWLHEYQKNEEADIVIKKRKNSENNY